MSQLPVRAIIFLGVPHRGLEMTGIETLVKGKPTQTLVNELKAGSPTLMDLNSRFAYVIKGLDLFCTFYETQPTNTIIQVSIDNQ